MRLQLLSHALLIWSEHNHPHRVVVKMEFKTEFMSFVPTERCSESRHMHVCGPRLLKRPQQFKPVISGVLLLTADVSDIKWLLFTTREMKPRDIGKPHQIQPLSSVMDNLNVLIKEVFKFILSTIRR